MKPTKVFLMMIGSFLLSNAFSQELTLDSILVRIERQHPMLQEFSGRAKAMETYAGGARSWMAPMAGIGTFMTPYPGQNPESMERGAVMVSFEQSIPNRNKLNASEQLLKARSGTFELQRKKVWNQLRFEARTAAYSLLIHREKISAIRKQIEILQVAAKMEQTRLEGNKGSLGGLYRTEARLAELQNMLAMTKSNEEEQQTILLGLMGLDNLANIKLVIGYPILPSVLLEPGESDLASVRSDVQEINQQIKLMRLNQELQRMQSKPEYKLRFDHMQPLGSTPVQFTAMAMVSIPIAPWSSSMYKSEIAGMNHEIGSMEKNREALIRDSKIMVRRMLIQIASMKEQVKRYEESILPSMKRNYEAQKISWEENRGSLMDLLEAWEVQSMTEIELLNKKESLYLMLANYEKIIEQ